MKRLKIIFAIISYLLLALPTFLFAQESPNPNIAYVFPAGAERGTKLNILIGGNKFNNTHRFVITGGGIKSKVLEVDVPFTEGGKAQLRMKLEKEFILANPGMKEKIESMGKDGQRFLRNETMKIPENKRQIDEADASQYLRELSSNALAETVEVELEISPDATIGERTLYIVSPNGISNPMRFYVGDLKEFSKESLRKTAYKRARTKEYWGRAVSRFRWATIYLKPFNNPPIDIILPCVANGQITEGNTDTWRFKAKKGQNIIMAISAQSILPYISDAVPGWFQTAITVRNSKGKEVAHNDDFYHRPDSYIKFKVPADDEYTVEVYDAVHRGREDLVYRLMIGEIPFVESVYPLAVKRNEKTTLKLIGENLKTDKIEVFKKSNADFELKVDGAYHNRIPLMVRGDSIDASGDTSPRKLGIPAEVDGIIAFENKVDTYKVDLTQGEKIIAEIFARRYDSPLDSYITISDSKGKILASADDYEDLSYGFVTHHADSRLEFTPKTTGTYLIKVGDTSGKASRSHAYRLSVRKPTPSFTVVATPSILNMRNGGCEMIKLKAFKKDGFDEPIFVAPKNLPKGWQFFGGKIEKGKDEAELIIKSTRNFKPRVAHFNAVASTRINNQKIVQNVSSCEDMMQAFYYRHNVPFSRFYACTGNVGTHLKWFKEQVFFTPNKPIKIIKGKPYYLYFTKHRIRGYDKLIPVVSGTDKLTIEKFAANQNGTMMVIHLNEKAKVGDRGTFNVTMNTKHGRKVFCVDRIPNISFVVVSQEMIDKEIALAKEKARKNAELKAKKTQSANLKNNASTPTQKQKSVPAEQNKKKKSNAKNPQNKDTKKSAN